MRQSVVKYFYLDTASTLSFTLHPVTNNANSYLILSAISNDVATSEVTLNSPNSNSNNKATYISAITGTGFYSVKVITPDLSTVTLTHSSDAFSCPYTSTFTDRFGTFQGCTIAGAGTPAPGLPCLSYDFVNLVCLQCLSGYNLIDGRCLFSINCGDREWTRFGVCYQVSATCGNSFDLYTG